MRVPFSWITLLLAVGVVGAIFGLMWFQVIEVSALFFALTNVVVLTLVFVFAVLGGAFAGMLMTHRMLANREFSPVERTILETHAEVKALGKRLEALEAAMERPPVQRP